MIVSHYAAPVRTELVRVSEALGRICAKNVYSAVSLPVERASQLDGIAVRFSDFEHGMPDFSKWVSGRDYVRADTGDDFDDVFDTIIPIEETSFRKDGGIAVEPEDPVEKGQFVRGKGSVIASGELLLAAESKITPRHLGLLTSGGIEAIEAVSKPLVAFIPTGDELIPAGNTPRRGQNIESNSAMIGGLLEQWGADIMRCPIVCDREKPLQDAIEGALASADIVLINGGSSRGDEDIAAKLLKKIGSFVQHGIKAIPGVPIALSAVSGKPVINIPGPPYAAFCAMDWCVRPLVFRQLKYSPPKRRKVMARLTNDVPRPPLPYEYIVRLQTIENGGECEARAFSMQDRHAEVFMKFNALHVMPGDVNGYKTGERIEAELLD
ncbi:MAG: molybdopterin molybdotransferase MoeA [Synergistaceae bacterium]|nr:molybdopterin molybdotransferase MoeA [Synergistaceae bacterium]